MKNQTMEKNTANTVNRVQQLLTDVLILNQYGNSKQLIDSNAASHLVAALEQIAIFDLKANEAVYRASKRSTTAAASRVSKATASAQQTTGAKLTKLQTALKEFMPKPEKTEATPAQAKAKKPAAKKPAAKAAPKKSAKKAA